MPRKEGNTYPKRLFIALALIWAIAFSQEAPWKFQEQGSLFFVSSYPESRTLNSICAFSGSGRDNARFYAVGDSGILLKMKGLQRFWRIPGFPEGYYDLDVEVRTLDRNFNLIIGVIPGRYGGRKNGGESWSRVHPSYIDPLPHSDPVSEYPWI